MYELEVAYQLYLNGEKILRLGRKIADREFDIETENYLVECKNIDWHKSNISKEQSQIGNQNAIAQRIGKKFIVISKNIPDDIKKWFNYKFINFIES